MAKEGWGAALRYKKEGTEVKMTIPLSKDPFKLLIWVQEQLFPGIRKSDAFKSSNDRLDNQLKTRAAAQKDQQKTESTPLQKQEVRQSENNKQDRPTET